MEAVGSVGIKCSNAVPHTGGLCRRRERRTSISISSGVTEIGSYAFRRCNSLTSIEVEEENPVYDSRENCNAVITKESNTLILGCNNTIIPSSVTEIADYAFKGYKDLTSISIPSSVTSIGDESFDECSGLTSIKVEEGNSSWRLSNHLTTVYTTGYKNMQAFLRTF